MYLSAVIGAKFYVSYILAICPEKQNKKKKITNSASIEKFVERFKTIVNIKAKLSGQMGIPLKFREMKLNRTISKDLECQQCL